MKNNYLRRLPVLLLVFVFLVSWMTVPVYADKPNNSGGNGNDKGVISGYVWLDSNEDGKMDLSESKIDGIDIEITNNGGHAWGGPSSLYGYYSYNAFNNGNHIVSVDLTKLKAKGYRITKLGGDSKIDPNTGKSDSVKPENKTMNIGLIKIDNNTTTTSQPISKLFLNKTVDKNQLAQNEEFVMNYTIQPQDIPQDLVPSELYQKNGADISLVVDTSGSMAWNLEGDTDWQGEPIYKYIDSYIENNNGQYYKLSKDSKYGYGMYKTKRVNIGKWWNTNYVTKAYIYFDYELDSFTINSNYEIFTDTNGKRYIGTNNNKFYVDLTQKYSKTSVKEQSRMDIVKKAAKNFVNKFNDYSNVKIGLVDYDSYVKSVSTLYTNSNKFSEVNGNNMLIDSLDTSGGTNIGDGLRGSYYQLSSDSSVDRKKYVVLLTDGEPTFWSYYFKNYNDYKYNNFTEVLDKRSNYIDESYGNKYYYNHCYDPNYSNSFDITGGGNNDNDGNSLKYAKDIASMISQNKSITPFMIAFSKDATSNKLADISNVANNGQPGFYKEATTADDLNEIYAKIAESIMSDLTIYGLQLQETFPDGISIAEMSNGLKLDPNNSQRIIGDIGNVNYTLDKENRIFKAEPITFWVKLQGTKLGDYVLGQDSSGNSTSFVTYKDIDGNIVNPSPSFPPININIYDNEPPKIDATLNNGENNAYDLDIDVNKPSKIILRSSNNGDIIASQDNTNDAIVDNPDNENIYKHNLQFSLNSSNILEKDIYIEAIDKDGKKTVETVPLINSTSEMVGSLLRINLQTELNTRVNEILVNNNVATSDKVTDNGNYSCTTDEFNDGNNVIKITVTNGYNNSAIFTFNSNLNPIINHGMFVNDKIQIIYKVVRGIPSDFAIDFITSGDPIVKLYLDKDISYIECTLYKVSDDNVLGLPITDGIKLYDDASSPLSKVVNGIQKFNISDFQNPDSNKVITVGLPKSDTNSNHYLLKYKIATKIIPDNKTLSNSIEINAHKIDFNIDVVDLPKLQ